MERAILRNAFPAALLATLCLLGRGALWAQEAGGSGGAGANASQPNATNASPSGPTSATRIPSTTSAAPGQGTAVSGRRSSWIAGRNSFGSPRQTGGVWRSASSFGTTIRTSSASANASVPESTNASYVEPASASYTESTPSAAPGRGTAVSGGRSSWATGRSNFGSPLQSGGVWRDGSSFSSAAGAAPRTGAAIGAFPFGQPQAPQGFNLAPAGATSTTGAAAGASSFGQPQAPRGFNPKTAYRAAAFGKTQALRNPIGLHPSLRPQLRAASSGRNLAPWPFTPKVIGSSWHQASMQKARKANKPVMPSKAAEAGFGLGSTPEGTPALPPGLIP